MADSDRNWLRPLGAWLLLLVLATCGGATTVPDGGGSSEEAVEEVSQQDEQQSELGLPDGATIVGPSAETCTAGRGATGGDRSFLTYIGLVNGALAGQGGIVATGFGSADQETYQVAFGAF